MKWFRVLATWFKRHEEPALPPPLSPAEAEEFTKLQRLLRRQTLLAEQQAEQLAAIRERLGSVDQNLLNLRAGGEVEQASGASFGEADILAVLDTLDRALGAHDMGDAARALVEEARESLYDVAQLRPLARVGTPPDTLGCRIVEVMPEPEAEGFKVTRVIRQGYSRGDGSQIREAVVIVSGASNSNLQ